MADTFDLLLTRDLSRAHILDFNPYAPRTDPLLFTYDDLCHFLSTRNIGDDGHPELRVIDSRTHPAAISNAPAHQHNMVPFEALNMSSGRDIEEFAAMWRENIRESMKE
jgi:D123